MRLTFRLACLTTFSTLIYLVATIWAGGGPTIFFSDPARTTVFGSTILLAISGLFTQANVSPGEREDRSNRWVLAVFAVLGIAGAIVPSWCDRHDVWRLGGAAVRWLGVALFVVGGVLRMWPVFVLGRRFSGLVAIQPGHTLVTGGIYRIIRNPSYLGLIVNAIGWALVFRSLAGLWLAVANLVPLIARIHAEEALLRAHFGDEYARYCRDTWRLVPGLY